MSTPSPQNAVFTVTELLEAILSHAPAKTIFVAQGVSRHFQDVISSSPNLQHKLHLRPPDLSNTMRWTVLKAKGSHGPRVVRFDTQKAGASLLLVERDVFERPLVLEIASSMNPILVSYPRNEAAKLGFTNATINHEQELMACDGPGDELLSVVPSWKRMYLTDRPCKKTWVWLQWRIGPRARNQSSTGILNGIVSTNALEGFTLGTLVDAVLDKKVFRYDYTRNGTLTRAPMQNVSMRDMIRCIERCHGGMAVVDGIDVGLRGVMLPEEGERELVADV